MHVAIFRVKMGFLRSGFSFVKFRAKLSSNCIKVYPEAKIGANISLFITKQLAAIDT